MTSLQANSSEYLALSMAHQTRCFWVDSETLERNEREMCVFWRERYAMTLKAKDSVSAMTQGV